LNKAIFEPVPIFVDSFGNFVLLNWEYVYKGSIRDFYPPVDALPPSEHEFQIYAESLGKLDKMQQHKLLNKLGRVLPVEELSGLMDFAFLCLHGTSGEDGRIQGLLEYMGIPYSGSGILSSAIGMNKAVQKEFMKQAGFEGPAFKAISQQQWALPANRKVLFETIKTDIRFPLVVKAANQGSSIGISVLADADIVSFEKAVNKAFFNIELTYSEWSSMDNEGQVNYIRTLTDIRDGIGLPLSFNSGETSTEIYHPEQVLNFVHEHFKSHISPLFLRAYDGESQVLVEEFIEGKEFSCIVVRNELGDIVALPPTEIRKGKELFDYRSKYLPGLSRKITPINLPTEQINKIRKDCEQLFLALKFNVYARIDGFINAAGHVFLNDPNTTSGMMPSSFFFHQAAEIGLNPSQFLTYIIRTSLLERVTDFKDYHHLPHLLERLDAAIAHQQLRKKEKTKVAVIFGGYSSERHISVESGRNIYEKLASSEKYEPIPVFLTGDATKHALYLIPINLLLKDNADDIQEKVQHFAVHEVIAEIINSCASITNKYATSANIAAPKEISYEQLAQMVDVVFIALHGRPGEDGVIQTHLERVGLPYNGSGTASSQITINKYDTNELLMKAGLLAAKHTLAYKKDWKQDAQAFIQQIVAEYPFPFIAKPVDDGCSSAVKKIKTTEELKAFAELIFREGEELIPAPAAILHLKLKEEFPNKDLFLIEELIGANDAKHFLEVTGGMLTHYNAAGELQYEVFEASEALSEGDILSLEEKFLAGQGQNITPARYAKDNAERQSISNKIKAELEKAARVLGVEGYCRIDAFVRVYDSNKVEVVFIEINSLPGMTPATCIFHQSAINGYKPYDFINGILDFGIKRKIRQQNLTTA
jgi:D-alanine-D-alanine ligase